MIMTENIRIKAEARLKPGGVNILWITRYPVAKPYQLNSSYWKKVAYRDTPVISTKITINWIESLSLGWTYAVDEFHIVRPD